MSVSWLTLSDMLMFKHFQCTLEIKGRDTVSVLDLRLFEEKCSKVCGRLARKNVEGKASVYGVYIFISVKGFVNWRMRKQAFLLGGVLRINTLGNLQYSN